ncbi:MAG: 2-isopropylmalate synthase [Deltaproteobacteria bacterium]|nr:2-isopropylmalate synthase [Deltaproteobacteria bacterium]
MDQSGLLFDWNQGNPDARAAAGPPGRLGEALVLDETLRDGIQSPSAVDPHIDDKVRLLHLMDELGIVKLDVGLPGAGAHQRAAVKRLCEEIRDAKLSIQATAACRTVISDIAPAAEVVQETGVPLEIYAFIGSSPIRQYAEEWDVSFIEKQSVDAIKFAVSQGLSVAYVTEDTTRSRPDQLRRLFLSAIEAGARRLCLCDTVGHSTPEGARALVQFALSVVKESGVEVGLDWHGHNDRGLSLANALAAGEAGCTRLHGCAAGIGERVGNTSSDQLLVNLKLVNHPLYGPKPMTRLVEYVQLAARVCGHQVPINYPLAGPDAFRTATGVHAAAIIKAQKKGDAWLADRVYSGVPAGEFGKEQEIEVGPMSGLSNVKHWLARRGHASDDALAKELLAKAKQFSHTLTEAEVTALLGELKAARA